MMVGFHSCFFSLTFSCFLYTVSFTLADSENNLLNNDIWETKEVRTGQHEPGWEHRSDIGDSENENQIPKNDIFTEGNGGKRKWSSLLTFDRLKNLTEKAGRGLNISVVALEGVRASKHTSTGQDKGPGNGTKVIFINSEDHLRIYENNDDDDEENETGIQDRDEQRFSLLSPEGVLSPIHSSEEKSLERTKRQAEGGKRRCRCRRKGRRVVRRRRRRRRGRRRRVGQARQGRRRRRGRRRGAGRRRRGRRRCVCRKKGTNGGGEGGEEEGEGKGDEEPEVEEADGEGETTTTEGGGEEPENGEEGKEEEEGNGDEEEGEGEEGDGEEGEGEEGDKSKVEEENEDSEEEESMESEDESDEKGKSSEESKKKEIPSASTNHEVPVYVIYPGTSNTHGGAPSADGTPMYTTLPVPFSPYPYYTGSHSTLHGTNHNLSKM